MMETMKKYVEENRHMLFETPDDDKQSATG
jgi:hypothetical protein